MYKWWHYGGGGGVDYGGVCVLELTFWSYHQFPLVFAKNKGVRLNIKTISSDLLPRFIFHYVL